MQPAVSVLTPQCIATEAFSNVNAAVARLDEIYERNTRFLRDRFEAYANGESISTRVRATYPFVRITIATHARLDSRLSYGFVAGPGVYETTITRPDLFRAYLTEQINLLIENHGAPVEIGESSEPIPVHFAYRRDINIEAVVSDGEKLRVQRPVRDVFDTPDLAAMDDAIANGTLQRQPGIPEPLALFRAARVDYSLHRLFHYTGTDPEHFQNFGDFHELPVLCRCLRALKPRANSLDLLQRRRVRRARQRDHAQCSPGRRNVWRCPRAHAADASFPSRRAWLSRHHDD
jgi:AMP nucleosidase